MVTITANHEMMSDRYRHDGKLSAAKGWAQIDSKQDASYFGQWANPITFEIFSYCEGDTTHTVCTDDADFAIELRKLIDWNKGAGYWLGIDPGWPDTESCRTITAAFERLGFGDELH